PHHDVGAGAFDMGGGHRLHVRIHGTTPEGFVKGKASSMVWGWILGAAIVGLVLVVFAGVGIYAYAASDASDDADVAPGATAEAAETSRWDGKRPFVCGGNDVVALSDVTATAGVKAGGNCRLTLTDVSITAPVGIDASANAKVVMTGGRITASTSAVVASANANVDLVGTTVTGRVKRSGNAKITGAN
ncbi:MAG: hypothetical protein KIS78_15640, partial [Labilithrix sp.]|nr:hypothetical protein [Labilithrix sp.]